MILTAMVSIGAVLIDQVISFWTTSSLQTLLALSWGGIQDWRLWQFVSYLFVQQPSNGLSFLLIFNLLLQLYMLWIIGTDLVERFGTSPFLLLYFLSGIFCGLCALFVMGIVHQGYFITGLYTSLFTLFVVWSMLYPDRELLFLFILPVSIRMLLAFALGASLLVNLSQGNYVDLTLTFSAAIFGYLFGTIVWGLRSPFNWMTRLDNQLNRLGDQIRKLWIKDTSPKIVDIRTGKPINDEDAFVDSMLDKISKKGEKSLNWWEKRRLDKISKGRKK